MAYNLRFASENFTAESYNRFRIIETHLYINLLWSVSRYVLRIQYTLMRTIF